MSKVIQALLLGLLSGCGPHPYLEAAGKFAVATDAQMATLGPVTSYRSALCHRQAQFDYAFRRLDGPVVNPTTHEPLSVLEYETAYPYDGATWAVRCPTSFASDEIVGKALASLAAYAKALGEVSGADLEGKVISSLATDAAALVTAAGGDGPGKIAASLAGPLAALGKAVQAAYAEKQVKRIVEESKAAVPALLTGIAGYLEATAMEARLVRQSFVKTVARADRLTTPGAVLEHVELAIRWQLSLDRIDRSLAASIDAVHRLAHAHEQLVAAGGKDDAPELKVLLADVASALADLVAVRNAIAGTGGN